MRFGDKKIVMIDFYSFNVNSLEIYFEEMALKGWILDKLSNLYIKFKKSEPRRIKYTIDVIDKITSYTEVNSESALAHREKLKDLGWEFSCEYNNLQIFYKEYTTEKNPISNKGIREKSLLFRNSLTELIWKLALIGFSLFINFLSILRNKDLEFLADNEKIITMVFFTVVLGVIVIDFVMLMKYRFKATFKEENNNIYWIRFKGISICIILGLWSILFLAFLLISSKEDFNLALSILAIISSVLLLAYLSQNKKDTVKKKILVSSGFILVIVTLFIINNSIIINRFKNRNKTFKDKEYSLSIKDFNDDVINDDYIYVDEKKSFLAHKVFYIANGNNMRLSYELFESDYKFMVSWNFNKMMKWFENQGINYNEIKTNLPNEVKVYTNEKENNYIILSSNKIIEVMGLDEIDNKEGLLEVVYNKIFTNTKEEVI